MTVDEVSQKTYTYTRRFYPGFVGPSFNDSSISDNIERDPENISPINPPILIPDRNEESANWHTKRKRFLADILLKLQGRDTPFKEHVEEYLRDQHRRNCKPNTIRNAFLGIDIFLQFLKKEKGRSHFEQIIRGDLYEFIEHEQDRGLKPSSVNLRLGILKAFLRFYIDQEVIHPDLLSKRLTIKVPDALPRAMDPDDVNKFLGVLKDKRDRAMMLLLLRTGMRIGELLNLLVKEVNLKEKRIEIYEAEKTRVGRVVYLGEDARSALGAWLKKRDPNRDIVFYAQGRNNMSYVNARNIFEKHKKKAGLSHQGYTLHCLRHTFASELLNAGMRLECLQQLLGHSSIEMTRRYARLTDKSREAEYFEAMTKIERGEIDGHYRFDPEL